MNEMLLRGCTLKNTGYILGLAVYTGNETRIQKNSAKTPNKIGMSFTPAQQTLEFCLLKPTITKIGPYHALPSGYASWAQPPVQS